MSDPAKLAELRALRNQAWRIVRDDIDDLQDGLEARGIGERIKDRAAAEAHEAWDEAVDIAAEHKRVVAATLLALVAWFLRGPIVRSFEALFGEEPAGDENVDTDKGDDP